MQIPIYPEDSEKAGPSYWKTMHNVASLYPMRPNPRHKRQFQQWLEYTIDHYVCPDPCIKNAKKYLRANPLDLSNRKTLSHDLCKMQNNVREDQGKQLANCDLVLGESKPSDLIYRDKDDNHGGHDYSSGGNMGVINQNAGYEQSPASTHGSSNEEIDVDSSSETSGNQVYPDVSGALRKYKKASTLVFKELCKEHKLPVPEIYHRPCPVMPTTSCTTFPVDKDGKVTGKPVVYLNPYNAGAKTTAHEFTHYYRKIKGLDTLAEDEEDVERTALKFIQDRFPGDEVSERVYGQTYYEVQTRSVRDRFETRYPRYAGRVYVPETVEEPKQEEGFLKLFDGAYGMLEQPFGLAKESLNLAYTPEIISAVTQTIVESNMSPIGSLLISSLLGLGIGGFVIMNKQTLVDGDRMLLAEISAHFTANVIRYANKDAAVHVMDDAEKLGQAVGALDGGQVVNILTGRSMFGGYDDGAGKQHVPLELDILPPAPPRFVTSGGPPPPIPPDLLFGGAGSTDPFISGATRRFPRRQAAPRTPPVQQRQQPTGIPMPFVTRTGQPTAVARRQVFDPMMGRMRPQAPPTMQRRRPAEEERLISGIDEEGFYHGNEAEVESLEGDIGPTNSFAFEGREEEY